MKQIGTKGVKKTKHDSEGKVIHKELYKKIKKKNWPYHTMVYAQIRIRLREWDAWNYLSYLGTKGSPSTS